MKLIINERTPLLNQMLREHFRRRKERKERYHLEILSQNPRKFKGKVNVRITRFSSRVPDPDGIAGGAKDILDAIVDAGVISDDNMKVVQDFSVNWKKCKQKEQRTEIEIHEYTETN